MTCNCIETFNERLAEHNTRLVPIFSIPRDGSESWTTVNIVTEKIDRKKRVGPVLAAATFCPFCGTRYLEDGGAS